MKRVVCRSAAREREVVEVLSRNPYDGHFGAARDDRDVSLRERHLRCLPRGTD